jgi:DNA-binding HxlR family transcriptional regulator
MKIARTFGCPSEFTLHMLGGKWTTIILCYLEQEPLRYADLRRLIPALSDKMLSERLANLSERGLVEKQRLAGRPREVYVLTSTGKSLGAALVELYRWGKKHADVFGVTVSTPRERAAESVLPEHEDGQTSHRPGSPVFA